MLKAVEIRQPEEEARALTGWIDEAVRAPGWLVFFTHDIAARPTPYGCRPETSIIWWPMRWRAAVAC